jgi:hypothetical protein
MIKQCRVPGCSGAATGYSTLCDIHKQAQRRHGHPSQTAIKAPEVARYESAVEARRAKNRGSEAWTILEARWRAVVDSCRATLSRYSEGHASNRIAVRAAHHIVTVAENTEPWTVVRTGLAMYLLHENQPNRFTTDAAFDFQLVRRVVRLAAVNAGTYWDHKENRLKRVYRDIPPRVVEAIAAPLKQAFGAPGLLLAAKEREEAKRVVDERQRLHAAMRGLE